MFLDIIVFLLRESIEAGALLSLLLCISNQNQIKLKWVWFGFAVGIISAIFYAFNFSVVSEWFEYAGQEVVDALLLLVIYFCLLALSLLLIFMKLVPKKAMAWLLGISIACTLIRELTEVAIFYIGFFYSDSDAIKGVTSGFVGVVIGLSFGVLYYHAISIWSRANSRKIQIGLLAFIAAGMLTQAIQLLMQIDWVSSIKPLWNTSWLLEESSFWGQMVYAIFGYEATPTAYEVTFYITTLLLVFSLFVIKHIQNIRHGIKTNDT